MLCLEQWTWCRDTMMCWLESGRLHPRHTDSSGYRTLCNSCLHSKRWLLLPKLGIKILKPSTCVKPGTRGQNLIIYFIHSYVDRHLHCFHILTIKSNASLNIRVHVSFQIRVFVVLNLYQGVEVCTLTS